MEAFESAFRKQCIISDMIDTVPLEILQLKFRGKLIFPGSVMIPSEVQDPPEISFTSVDPSAYYTLIMHNPDFTDEENPTAFEWHHWLVVNIPGGEVSMGEVKSEYVGAGPREGTGLQRFVYLLFKQPTGKQDFSELPFLTNTNTRGRGEHLNIRKFIKKHGLDGEGLLVAGNFFMAEWDEHVPKGAK